MNYQMIIIVMVSENSSGYYCQGNLQKGSLVLTSLTTFILFSFAFYPQPLKYGFSPNR